MAIQEYIKRIEVGTDEWEICAKALQDESGNPLTWAAIKELLEQSFDIVVVNELPTANASAYATYHNCLVLVPKTESTDPDMSDEYVIQRSGEGTQADPYTYRWEYIGCTAADLSDFVHKGTYTTQPVNGNTGAGGEQSISISYTGNAAGTGEIEYDKVSSIDSHTVPAHSHTVNKATASITYFSGIKNDGTVEVVTDVSADGTVDVAKSGIASVGLTSSTTHTTGDGAIQYVEDITGSAPVLGEDTTFVTSYDSFTGGSKAADTFTPNTPTTLDLTKFSGGSFNQGAKATLSYATLNNVMQSATVVNGVLSWTNATVSKINSFTQNGDDTFTAAKLNTGFYSAGSAAQFSEGTFTPAVLGSPTKKTVTISGGSYSSTKKYIKPTTTAAQVATVLTGVKASGKATVIKSTGLTTSSATFMTGATLSEVASVTLSHSINYATTSISVNVSVPINHEHTVNVSNHTHSLGNHTHDINLQNPNS